MKIYNSTHNNGSNILVFGSNLSGLHGAGAALQAKAVWGAKSGEGFGRTGQAWAIPTKDKWLEKLSPYQIKEFVSFFLRYAIVYPELTFLVTRIGCGLAGYTDADIAPMFAESPSNCDLPEGWRK